VETGWDKLWNFLIPGKAFLGEGQGYWRNGLYVMAGVQFFGAASDVGLTIVSLGANRFLVTGLRVGAEKIAVEMSEKELVKMLGEKVLVDGDKVLFRRGAYDTKALLQRDAQAAEKVLGIHGVSVSTNPAAKVGQEVRPVTASSLEAAGLKIEQTGGNLNHHTVELPNPITPDFVRIWNGLFK
jgi:hypothetical protein